MANLKWFFLFIIAAVAVFIYMGNSKNKEKKLEQEYRMAVAEAAKYRPELPDLPPKQDMEFPDAVITKLHRSLRSQNVEEAAKAMDIMWKIHDGEVLPVMKKYLSVKLDSCWSNCNVAAAMKNKIMDIITRDISQLNFELLSIAATDRSRDIRKRAVDTLSNFPTEEALEVMNKAMNDKDPEIRTSAMEGTVRINNAIKSIREDKINEITREFKKKTFKERISPEEILKALD